MELTCKPDLDRVLARFEAWWDRQIIDRPLVSVACSDPVPGRAPPPPTPRMERPFDVEFQVRRAERAFESTLYLAETLPCFMPNVGPELCATLYGCELQFTDDSSWSRPILDNIRDVLKLTPNLDSRYWRAIREMTDLSLQAGKGRWLTALADLHTNGDLLAALRDPQELCLDVADDREGVRLACEHVTTHFTTIFEDLYQRIAAAGQPLTTWTPALHAGRWYPVSCDFICMISPDQLEGTILPSLRREMATLERSLFHLDGPGAVKHLGAILDCEDLDALQWVYGAGATRAADWIDLYRQAQARHKALQIFCVDIPDALAVMQHLKPEGCWFCLRHAHTKRDIESFVRMVERWAAGLCV